MLNQEPEAIAYARAKAGLTKIEVATRLGKSPQLVGDIESGRRNATFETLQRLADIFNCPLVVLERKRWSA